MSNSDYNYKNKQLAEAIRVERLKKNYSQEYMALRLSISQNAYSRIERGQTKLDFSRLYAIADILEVEMDIILLSVEQSRK